MWRIVFRVSYRAFPGPLLNTEEIAPSFFSVKPTGATRERKSSMSNNVYSRNVDVLKEFGFDYSKWPKSSKVVDTIVWMPCLAKDANAEFPDEWINLLLAGGDEIYEMFPKGDAKKKKAQLSERNKKLIRIVFAHLITKATPCKGKPRQYRFIGLFAYDRADTNGVYYKKLMF